MKIKLLLKGRMQNENTEDNDFANVRGGASAASYFYKRNTASTRDRSADRLQ
jgi:hypothetical protein